MLATTARVETAPRVQVGGRRGSAAPAIRIDTAPCVLENWNRGIIAKAIWVDDAPFFAPQSAQPTPELDKNVRRGRSVIVPRLRSGPGRNEDDGQKKRADYATGHGGLLS